MALKLPKVIYVRILTDTSGKESFFAADDIAFLNFAVGETGKVGVYTMTSNLEVKGVIQSTEVAPD